MKRGSKSRCGFAPVVAAIGPALFVIIFLIEGAIRPGYSPMSEYVSALSLGSRGWVQIANFLIGGAGILLLAIMTGKAFWERRAGRIGTILLGIIGLCLFVSGPCVMDPVGTAASATTWHGYTHNILGAIVFLLMPIVPFVLLGRLKPQRRAWIATLILGIIIVAADVVFIAISKSPDLAVVTEPFGGLVQRLVLIPFMVWCVVLGLALYRRSRVKKK